jgi:hypothetical protein
MEEEMSYVTFGAPSVHGKGEVPVHSRMTFMKEKNRSYPVIVIYPGRPILKFYDQRKIVRVGALLSGDRNWILLHVNDGVYNIRHDKSRRPYIHVPVYIPVEFDWNRKALITCETRQCEDPAGFEFRIVDTIKFPVQLKSVG